MGHLDLKILADLAASLPVASRRGLWPKVWQVGTAQSRSGTDTLNLKAFSNDINDLNDLDPSIILVPCASLDHCLWPI